MNAREGGGGRGEERVRNVLTIAGSDPSGGAGIQADLRTFAALGVYGCAAITALTAQNTVTVGRVLETAPDFIAEQLDAVFDDVEIHAVKIGMLPSRLAVAAVANALRRRAPRHVVLDPVISSSTGTRLIDDAGLAAIREELLPLVTVVTPNAAEAGALAGLPVPVVLADVQEPARAIHALGPAYVLVTGGHIDSGSRSVDLLFNGEQFSELPTRRVTISAAGAHGTGCTFSAALAAFLARGCTVPAACVNAHRFVVAAIIGSGALAVGRGRRPLNQLRPWDDKAPFANISEAARG